MSHEKTVEPTMDAVQIRNTTRTSVTFRVPGRSIHLRPGQTTEVPRPYLETTELGALRRQGAVVEAGAVSPPPPAPAPTRGRRGGGDKGGGERFDGHKES